MEVGRVINHTMSGVDQMISSRLQLHDTNMVKLLFVSSGSHIFYLFVGRKAQVEWILREEPFVAKQERDPILVSPAKASIVALVRDCPPVDVLTFEGKPPKSADPIWDLEKVRRIAWIDDTGRGQFKFDNKIGWRIH